MYGVLLGIKSLWLLVASDAGKWFYQPTVLTDVKQNMLVSGEETFGPVAAITRLECVCVRVYMCAYV